MKFRKKPIVIEAEQVHQSGIEGEPPLHWMTHWVKACGGSVFGWTFALDHILIPTLEGVMRADISDYIICGVNGEFYPCKEDVFDKTYEAVEGGGE